MATATVATGSLSQLKNVSSLSLGNQTAYLRGTRSMDNIHTADALDKIRSGLAAIADQFSALGLSLSSPLLGFNIQEVALTSGTNTIVPILSAAQGAVLIVFILQDSTGGRMIAWDPAFKWTVVDIDGTANSTSVFGFVGRKGPSDAKTYWYPFSLPLTGQL